MFNRLYLSPGKVGPNAACNYWSNLGPVHQVPIMAGVANGRVLKLVLLWNLKFIPILFQMSEHFVICVIAINSFIPKFTFVHSEITEVHLSALIYRLFQEDVSSIPQMKEKSSWNSL